VDGRPSFEWGGEDKKGNYIFDTKRPGWAHGPIHDMLVSEGVTVVFHGHDHFYGKQDLDGIVYQECPQPNLSTYMYGARNKGGYKHGVLLRSSGHVRVSVAPESVTVAYLWAFLPGDGPNRQVAHSYTITKAE
jgi:hypothetical protein